MAFQPAAFVTLLSPSAYRGERQVFFNVILKTRGWRVKVLGKQAVEGHQLPEVTRRVFIL